MLDGIKRIFRGRSAGPSAEGGVRVVAPRGHLPGSDVYPAAPDAPPVPGAKTPVDRSKLAYYPKWHVPSHPRAWTFPAYLDHPNSRWLQALKRLYAHPISFPASLAPEAGLLLNALIRNIRPRVVIETGTFAGVSTIWIAAALAENGDGGVVHSFDDFGPIHKAPWRDVEMLSGRLEFVSENLCRAGVQGRVVLHPGNSSFEIRASHADLLAAGGVQFAYLDADHSVMGTWQDLWASEPVLQTGGFIAVHDTFPEYCGAEGGRHVLDHLNESAVGTYEKIDLYLSPLNYGLGLMRRIG